MVKFLKYFKGFGSALILFVFLVCLLSYIFQPARVHKDPELPPEEKVREAKELRDIALVGKPPELVVDVDYSEQEKGKRESRGQERAGVSPLN